MEDSFEADLTELCNYIGKSWEWVNIIILMLCIIRSYRMDLNELKNNSSIHN